MLHPETDSMKARDTAAPSTSAGPGMAVAYGAAGAIVAVCIASTAGHKKDERYHAAVAFARANPAVVAEVGQVNSVRIRRSIATQAAYIFSQGSVYQFRVCGPSGSANVVVQSAPADAANLYRFAVKEVVR